VNTSVPVLLSLALQALLQLFSVAMVPLSKGFTRPIPAIACCAAFSLALFLLARVQVSGTQLSVAIPLLSAAVPLLSVAMMLLMYGEGASPLKIGLLLLACLLIGAAASLK
jgi:multidrug transporter EmrE-like cation transporter